MIQNNPNHPNQCGKPNDKHTIGGLFIGALQMVMTWIVYEAGLTTDGVLSTNNFTNGGLANQDY